MATPNNLEIDDNDFVNAGKNKFNEAIKNLPIGLSVDNGILTVVLYKGVALTVDLTDMFPTRGEVASYVLPPVGSFDRPGLLQLAHDDDPDDLKSETKPLGTAGVVRLIEKFLTPPEVVTLASLLKGATKKETDAFVLALLKQIEPNTPLQTAFCEVMSRCGTTPTTGTITHRIRNIRHFEFVDTVLVPPTLNPVYTIRYDANDCDKFIGWNFDENSPNSSAPVRIVRDGIATANVTPTIERTDVRDYLIRIGKLPAGSAYAKYGWIYPKTQADNDGNAHTFEAYGGTSTTKATSDVGAPATVTCGSVVTNPTNPAPTVTGTYANQSVTKSGDQLLDPVAGIFSDTDALTLSATLEDGSALPAGISFYPTLAQPFNVNSSFPNQSVRIKLTATDTAGQKISIVFPLNVNRAVVNQPTLTGQKFGGDTRTVEGNSARVKILNTFSDGSTNDYVGGGSYSIVIPYPNQMAISTGANATGLITTAETISQDVPVTLVFTFPDGRKIEGPFTVVDKIAATSPITGYLINDINIVEGQQGIVQVYAVHADGNWTEVAQADGSKFEFVGQYPNGMSLSYGNTARALVQTAGNSVTDNVPVTVRFTFANGTTINGKVTVLNETSSTVDPNANPPSRTDTRNIHGNDFSAAAGVDPANWTPGYGVIQTGSWNWGSDALCSTNTASAPDQTMVIYTENGSQTSYNRAWTIAKVRPNILNADSRLGVGLRYDKDAANHPGYCFVIKDANTVQLIHNGFTNGPTMTFATQSGTYYWMKQIYEETGTDKARISGKIWRAGEVEPENWTIVWENQPRSYGYPTVVGGMAGSTACFDEWYDANYGALPTVYIDKIGYYVNTVGSGSNPDSIGFYYKGPQASYKFYIESETTRESMELYTSATNDPTVTLSGAMAEYNHRIIQALATRIWRGKNYKCRLDIVSGSTVLQSVPFTVIITTAGTLTVAYSTN